MREFKSHARMLRRPMTISAVAMLVVGIAASPAWATAPDAPAQPTVTQGNAMLNVAFVPPNDNGTPITSYTATCTSSDGGLLGSVAGPASPIAVPGTIGKTYTCIVVADNGAPSAPSPDSLPVVVIAAPAAPAQPTVSQGNALIQVGFVAPANNGAAITGYTATCTSSNGGTLGALGGASSPLAVPADIGKLYTCRVSATNSIGTGPQSVASASILVGLPSTPAAPAVGPADSAIVVVFSPPANNGSPISSYTALCVSSGNPNRFASGSSSPITVLGAINGVPYTCSLTATNGVGTSASSADSATVKPAGAPDNPMPPTVLAMNHAIKATFVPPANHGGSITNYEVDCTSFDGGVFGSASGANSPLTVGALTNGKTYTCDVTAFNVTGVGQSDASVPVVPNNIPDTPAKPTVVRGAARVIVSFVLPADNGNAITKSSATCTSSNGGVQKSVDNVPFDEGDVFSPITVLGLSNGKSYTCKVTVTNDAGTSAESPASSAVVPVSPPAAPLGVTAQSGVATGSTGPIIVSFHAGATNGSPITSFRATCVDNSTTVVVVKTGPASPLSVPGNTTGHSHTCSVAAISAGGTGPKTAAASVVVGTPGAPLIVKRVQTNHGITFTFAAPSGNGKPITSYKALCTSPDGGIKKGAIKASSPILVKGMTLGRTYNCVLQAQNVRGWGAVTRVGPLTINQ